MMEISSYNRYERKKIGLFSIVKLDSFDHKRRIPQPERIADARRANFSHGQFVFSKIGAHL